MNKEEVYDAKIAPLLEEVVNICKEHGIAMMAAFETPTKEHPHLIITTITVNDEGYNGVRHAEAMAFICLLYTSDAADD